MKIVINTCFGGFGLSEKGCMRYAEIKGFKLYAYYDATTLSVYGPGRLHESTMRHYSTKPLGADQYGVVREFDNEAYWSPNGIKRDDPALVQVVEELGGEADGPYSALTIVDVPDDAQWFIDEYDGNEHVAEAHRTWR